MLKTRFKTALIISIFLITAFSMLMSGCDKKYGNFYTLEEAYNNGLLTKENLEEIAYYVNDQLKYPEELDSKVEKKIKSPSVSADIYRGLSLASIPLKGDYNVYFTDS